jgi:DNA polymerase-3 subunit delta
VPPAGAARALPRKPSATRSYTRRMSAPKPVYMVCGDDRGKIDAWRSRVRERAEAEGGAGALEAFDARSSHPVVVAAALSVISLGAGDRYLLVDGVETWKAASLEPLEHALADMPPDTCLVLIARGKVSDRLLKAVGSAGGEVREYAGPKPWEMPRWAGARAAELGLRLDLEAAKALVSVVGDRRPERVARELEKLTLAAHPLGELSAEQVMAMAASETVTGAYDLADALVAGERATAFAIAEELGREERPTRLVFAIVRRLREVHRAAGLVERGASEKQVGSALRIPPWAAKRVVARARKADRNALERTLCAFAELEVGTRAAGGLDEDTAFSLALARSAP